MVQIPKNTIIYTKPIRHNHKRENTKTSSGTQNQYKIKNQTLYNNNNTRNNTNTHKNPQLAPHKKIPYNIINTLANNQKISTEEIRNIATGLKTQTLIGATDGSEKNGNQAGGWTLYDTK